MSGAAQNRKIENHQRSSKISTGIARVKRGILEMKRGDEKINSHPRKNAENNSRLTE